VKRYRRSTWASPGYTSVFASSELKQHRQGVPLLLCWKRRDTSRPGEGGQHLLTLHAHQGLDLSCGTRTPYRCSPSPREDPHKVRGYDARYMPLPSTTTAPRNPSYNWNGERHLPRSMSCPCLDGHKMSNGPSFANASPSGIAPEASRQAKCRGGRCHYRVPLRHDVSIMTPAWACRSCEEDEGAKVTPVAVLHDSRHPQ
jgi:hypothetical protein